MLTPYKYYPVICYFTDDEYSRIIAINDELEALLLTNRSVDKARIEELRISGYNLIARMDDKIVKLTGLINDHKDCNHMLIYCGATTIDNDPSEINPETGDSDASERLIQYISKSLYQHTDLDLKSFTYADSLVGRKGIIDDFINKRIQAIISIRCLDEGLNIPNIRYAFILSSSDDPKEYIQRRGRVLRRAEGKDYAEIYDFIAFPRSYETGVLDKSTKETEFAIVVRELRRVYEFARLSLNPEESFAIIDNVSKVYDKPNLRRILDGDE
jgi:superfamily II DNA or RNA helicase